MELLTTLFSVSLGAILVNNFIFAQFLGICPFMGVSKKVDTALGMGVAVIFVMGVASAVCWPINNYILIPNKLVFMQTVTYILVIASLVQFVEMFLQKAVPTLYQALGVYLPLITTNCAVLGVALINVQRNYSILEGVVYGFATAAGFFIAIVLMAGIREKIEDNDIPESFKGTPIVLLTACLMAIAFSAFQGLNRKGEKKCLELSLQRLW